MQHFFILQNFKKNTILQICKITKNASSTICQTSLLEVGMSDCAYLRSNTSRNTSMSQNALDVVKDANGKPMTPGSLYTYTENENCFWQVYTIVKSQDDAHNGMKARIYYVPTDYLQFKHLDPNTKSVWFDVVPRTHPDYGCIKTCSFRMEDVARYVIPAHCNFIRNPGRILHASTDHLTVGSQITVNPDYKRICLLHSTTVAATRYLLDDTYEIYVTESDKDHFSIKFRKKSAQAKEIHIRDIFTMNAHLFVPCKNGGIELQIAQIRAQCEAELQTIQSKSSEAIQNIQNQMAKDCKKALTSMQDRVMSIAGNELQAKQLEVDELKKQLAKAEQDRQRRNDGNGQSSNGGSGDSDPAWSTVMDLAQSSGQSSNGGSNGSAAQTATGDGRRDDQSSINLWITSKCREFPKPTHYYTHETKRPLIDLKRDYCNQNRFEPSHVHFLFKDRLVLDTQTPDDLKMKTGNIIYAMTHGSRGQDVLNGGSQKRGKNTDDSQNGPDSSNGGSNGSAAQTATRDGRRDGEDSILFLVNNKWKTPPVWYSFKTKRMLVDMKRHYCGQNGLEQNKMRFLLNERVVFDTETPDDLKMKTGDAIDAMTYDEYSETTAFGKELKLLKEPYGSRGKDVELATTSNGGSQKRERNNNDASSASGEKRVKKEEEKK